MDIMTTVASGEDALDITAAPLLTSSVPKTYDSLSIKAAFVASSIKK